MVIDPKPLEPGWIKRCLLNALRLVIRRPLYAFLVYVMPVLISCLAPYQQIMLLLGAASAFFGILLCFKADHLQNFGVFDFISRFIFSGQLIVIVAIGVFISPWEYPSYVRGVDHTNDAIAIIVNYFSFASAVIFRLCFFVPAMLTILSIGGFFLYLWWVSRSSDQSPSRDDVPYYLRPAYWSFSTFTLFLIIDLGMNAEDANRLSEETEQNIMGSFNRLKLMSVVGLLCMIPFGMAIMVPFVYAVYRELFFQQGPAAKERQLSLASTTL